MIVHLFVHVVGRKSQPLIPAGLTALRIKQRQVATLISPVRQHEAVIRRTAPILRLGHAVSLTVRSHNTLPSPRSRAATASVDPSTVTA